MNTHLRGAAVVGGIAVLTLAGTGVALAAVKAQSAATQSVTSASWGLTPQAMTSTDAPTLTWATLDQLTQANRYFRITNTGTETVNAAAFTVVVQRSNSNGQVPNLNFVACVGGTWNTANDTCSGKTAPLVTTDGKNGATVVLTNVPSAPEATLSVRVTPATAQLSYTYSALVGTTVSLTQTGASATITNS